MTSAAMAMVLVFTGVLRVWGEDQRSLECHPGDLLNPDHPARHPR